jgi:predicted transposase/invertase (TIGR01784 family)
MLHDFGKRPHDHLFRASFSRVESAALFLSEVLPEPVSRACRWEKLQVLPGKFVNTMLDEVESDLLYQVPLEGEGDALVYILFEHQSTPDRWMPLRLLTYMSNIWEAWRKNNPTSYKLPPILPMVLYQGAGGWTVAPSFGEMLAVSPEMRKALAPYTPDFSYRLFDLAREAPADFPGPDELRLIVAAMKAVMQPPGAMLGTFEAVVDLIEAVQASEKKGWSFQLVVSYIYSMESRVPFEQIQGALNSTQHAGTRSAFMTIAQELEERGLKKGRVEGLVIAIRKAVGLRFGPPAAEEAGAQLAAITSMESLDAIHNAVMTAPTWQEVKEVIARASQS